MTTTRRRNRSPLAVATLVALSFYISSFADAGTSNHRYKENEHVELWVNKVGPYANPQEAYEYYTLPYCAPDTKHHPEEKDGRFNELKSHSIGESLGGHALRHSGHDLVFKSDDATKKTESCTTQPLSKDQADKFALAVEHRWFYQMYLDDLPLWGMVGEMLPSDPMKSGIKRGKDDLQRLDAVVEDAAVVTDESLKPYVYTERKLTISYNGDRIVKVEIASEPMSLEEIKVGGTYEFKLHVHWEPTNEEFYSRFERYLDHAFFKHQIHWFSIFNSFMMVLFLSGLVALILLRTLRRDYAKYGMIDLEEGDDNELVDEDGKPLMDKGGAGGGEESGWKQVHGDVFRAPDYLPLFAAILGAGWQLVILTLGVIIFAVLGPLHGEVHEERGELFHAIITCYSLSSIVAGYASGKYFKTYYPTTALARNSTTQGTTAIWQATMGLTVVLLPTITVVILSVLNGIALYYGTVNSIPFFVMFKMFLIWIFVTVPLCVVGTLLGRGHATFGGVSTRGTEHFPCRVNSIPRPIPEEVPWYGKPLNIMPVAGLLSFGSIFIELYYVLTSLWNYKFYHVYGFLLGVYAILTIVVGLTSIIVVYFCLNAENYLWQWTAFGSGASTSLYVFLYGVYYFVFKTSMNGFLQTMFYFGYTTLIAVVLGLLCGTLGHFSASRFVRAIFQNVKVD